MGEGFKRAGLVVAAVAALVVLGLPAGASAGPTDRSCGWILEPSYNRENILFPEETTRYLAGVVPALPGGGSVEIKGQFPRARYMSLQTYNAGLQSLSVIRDEQIVPDPGSTNPFPPGADRTSAKRDYTVRIVDGKQPAGGPAPNTLYNTSADGSKNGNGLAYRIYLPDKAGNSFGGVPAPSLTIVLPGGARIPLPTCPDPLPDTTSLSKLLAGAGLPLPQLPTPGVLAPRRPVWHKYVNAPTTYTIGFGENEVVPTALLRDLAKLTEALPAGLGENADNKYVYAHYSREHGRVVRLRGKLPTTPKTLSGQPRMGAGQLRFWSMCSANRTTQAYGCVVDENVPVDAKGYFTIVFSTKRDRPRTARARCGVAWLPWGPDQVGILAMRNMLPAPDFTHSIQNASTGTEAETLGPYLPKSRYFPSPGAFDRRHRC